MVFLIGDAPPSNTLNYEEIDLQDDPGCSQVFLKNGRKGAENAKDHSKTSKSVMWCGSASAEFLLLMVVSKAKNLYKRLVKGVLKGYIYSVTKRNVTRIKKKMRDA